MDGRMLEVTAKMGNGIINLRNNKELWEEKIRLFAPLDLWILKQEKKDQNLNFQAYNLRNALLH